MIPDRLQIGNDYSFRKNSLVNKKIRFVGRLRVNSTNCYLYSFCFVDDGLAKRYICISYGDVIEKVNYYGG